MLIPIPFTGGCACGAVRYTATEAPVAMMICHCRDCQRATGTGGAPVLLVAATAVHTIGTPAWHEVTAANGHRVRRAFCSGCGSPLLAEGTRGPFVAIKAGSLDDPSWFRPTRDVWTERAQPWAPPDPARRQVTRDP